MVAQLYRPLVQVGSKRPENAFTLAGGWGWFTHAEECGKGGSTRIIDAAKIPSGTLEKFVGPRMPICGLEMTQPRLMAVLNVTPDSFSDGGEFLDPEMAVMQAKALLEQGADILDIGGESTRPGAETVTIEQEIQRIEPVISTIRRQADVAISLDTRKSDVAKRGVAAGVSMLNDVSAMSYDSDYAEVVRHSGLPVCLMHAQGDPKTMQANPTYTNVVFEVYDYLQARIDAAVAAGIRADRIVVDPGIGFGKTLEHNLLLLKNISVFHGLGVPILIGVSRKRFIGTIGNEPVAAARGPGSIAVALAMISQGVQIARVHDMKATKQALDLHIAATGMG